MAAHPLAIVALLVQAGGETTSHSVRNAFGWLGGTFGAIAVPVVIIMVIWWIVRRGRRG